LGRRGIRMTKKRLTMSQKKGIMGVVFVSPWILGFIFLFAVPMIQSFYFSINNLKILPEGYTLQYEGLGNYIEALRVHPTFNRILAEAVGNMLVNVPLIIIFSLFSATLLNQKFKGRTLARAIFFLPVIIASRAITTVETGDYLKTVASSMGADMGGMFNVLKGFQLEETLINSGMNAKLVGYLTGSVNRIYQIVSSSGVQILIFLSGLQSISPSIYEASHIEGATRYEDFWKITFPMMSPLILTNTIYSIIDSFTNNEMTSLLNIIAFSNQDFSLSAAMAWIYFIIISIILIITTALISKKVFYLE
jgi:ABC-type sugar transport system permease subunit